MLFVLCTEEKAAHKTDGAFRRIRKKLPTDDACRKLKTDFVWIRMMCLELPEMLQCVSSSMATNSSAITQELPLIFLALPQKQMMMI